VAFHLTYPTSHPPTLLSNQTDAGRKPSCHQDPKSVLQDLLSLRTDSMMSWREQFPVPQNLLRNLARQTCQTKFTMIPDNDMIPVEVVERAIFRDQT
jgi:hypothetical protein